MNGKKVKCNYCSKSVSGWIFIFKHHLVEIRKNFEPCVAQNIHLDGAIRASILDAFDLENITFDTNVDCDEDEDKDEDKDGDDGGEDVIRGMDIQTWHLSIYNYLIIMTWTI